VGWKYILQKVVDKYPTLGYIIVMEEREMNEMTVAEAKRVGADERTIALMGEYQTPGGIARIVARKIGAATFDLFFIVGDKEQQIGIDAQLRLEHAIRDGKMVRM
jgi:hypothetical protein